MAEDRPFFEKHGVTQHEYNMHLQAFNLNIVPIPQIHSYDAETQVMKMQRLNGLSVADMYGEEFTSAPNEVVDEMRRIVSLLLQHGIAYRDITGYNFMEFEGKLWIIDFEHAISVQIDPFIIQFIEGENGWNPEFL